MIEIFKIILSILPVFVFLGFLIFFDSFRLIKFKSILITIIIGCLTAVLALVLNSWIITKYFVDIAIYSRYLAPVIEEALKSIFIFVLIFSKRIGFMVDAAIFGFSIGAGFALIENIYYLKSFESTNILLWIIRGFGTAVMHGGTTAILSIITKSFFDRQTLNRFLIFLPGILIAIIIHSFFNHFILSPVLITLVQLIVLPLLIAMIFVRSEIALRNWLELGLDTDVKLLEYINSGNIVQTKIGIYLNTIKEIFSWEVVADIICFMKIHLELSIRAKGILLMRNAGFAITPDYEIKAKLKELKYLEKSIGRAGRLLVSPILYLKSRDLWQLYLLK